MELWTIVGIVWMFLLIAVLATATAIEKALQRMEEETDKTSVYNTFTKEKK